MHTEKTTHFDLSDALNKIKREMKEALHEKRILGLDVVRAIAIIMVVIAHSSALLKLSPVSLNFPAQHASAINKQPVAQTTLATEKKKQKNPVSITRTHLRRSRVWTLGELGVELFFVLSGFLIGNILIKEFLKNQSFSFKQVGNFWIRRWLRTLPIYWIILSLFFLFFYNFSAGFGLSQLSYYVFMHNLFTPHPAFFREAWSLAVEEWFYLTVPVILFFASRIFIKQPKEKILWRVFVAYILFFTGLRCINFINPMYGGDYDTTVRKIVMFRLDAIMYGVIMAMLLKYKFEQVIKKKYILLFLSIAGTIVSTFFMYYFELGNIRSGSLAYELFNTIFIYSLLPLIFCLCLPYAYAYKPDTSSFIFLKRSVTHISKISYSIYLTHYSLLFINFFGKIHATSYPEAFGWYILYWVTVITISTILYHYVEQPILKLRDIKFRQSKVTSSN